ncbi:hypothetical protein TWF788_005042 [Orbilia oligospora]|uniref:Uncharacterized protein n=1 Tax=Orbilia oligospora TaxID=2813651 RepID=A0A6G1MEC6_ORBOL|nr:hypothetical protein TWF788_005042 [Orbilia oligospora]KAF3225263.1 hypothetical protein TWF191_005312 [Orbilia oligospora]KAF3254535.1 hypothetical protein TWF192_003298 [Orbilia oligospora]
MSVNRPENSLASVDGIKLRLLENLSNLCFKSIDLAIVDTVELLMFDLCNYFVNPQHLDLSNHSHQRNNKTPSPRGSSSEDPEYRAIQDHTENDDVEGLVSSSSYLQNHEPSPNLGTEASAGPSFPAQNFPIDIVPTSCSSLSSSEGISGFEGPSTEILRSSNAIHDYVDVFWYEFVRSISIPNLQDPPGPALSDSGSSSSSSGSSTPKSDSGSNTESTTPASSPAASRTGLSPRDETLDTPASSPVALGVDPPPRDETLATLDDSPYIPSNLTQYALEQYKAAEKNKSTAENPTANAPEFTCRETARRNPPLEGREIRKTNAPNVQQNTTMPGISWYTSIFV